jgi:hypothetical protein
VGRVDQAAAAAGGRPSRRAGGRAGVGAGARKVVLGSGVGEWLVDGLREVAKKEKVKLVPPPLAAHRPPP